MARFVFGYRCPDCGGKFAWERTQDPPDRCPHCKAWVSEDEPEVFVPKAPAIKKSAYTKSVDRTYREMERASIERADEAAGMLESEYAAQPRDEHDGLVRATQKEEIAKLRSELKLTNMKDPSQMREGETAHIGSSPLMQGGASFQAYAGSVSGSVVSPVVPFIKNFTTPHSQRAASMIRAGEMGRANTSGTQVIKR